MTVIAFDYGTRKIGVAYGQSITGSASPLDPLPVKNLQPDWSRLVSLVNEWQTNQLLVGLPLNMDGTESRMSKHCKQFATRLEQETCLPVSLIDERLSSRAARERLGKPALSGRDSRVDSVAAVIMIETWFNSRETNS